MLEIFLIFCIVFLILTFFYKQAVCEFRINQIEWSQNEKLRDLFQEKVPIVVRGIPPSTFWTHEDVQLRLCYGSVPVFQEYSITEWIQQSDLKTDCPWPWKQGAHIASVSGLDIWSEKWMNQIVVPPMMKWWIRPYYHCWTGNVGLQKLRANWTCIFPTEGEIIVSIMTELVESSLPRPWKGVFPSRLTARDTPFISDLKFMDIILRPGTCIFMPAHWFISWEGTEKNTVAPMVCSISYHSPVSILAFYADQRSRV